MLHELFIQNLAIIKQTTITFDKGLNVFTGETGAGKSIVIDAINAVLGQRTSKEIVRHGEQKASITASFRELTPGVVQKLASFGFEPEDGELILTREIFADAKSNARIMGRPVTISILKEIGTELIAIHGQHDNQILLVPDKHMELLDRYGDFEPLKQEYYNCYANVVHIKREMKQAAMGEQEKSAQIELLTEQIEEIEGAELKDNEEEILSNRRTEMKNSAKILQELLLAYSNIYGTDGEGGSLEHSQVATSALEKAMEFYEDAESLYARMLSVSEELSDISDTLQSKLSDFNFDKNALLSTEDRLALVKSLKRKYGETEADVIAFANNAREKLSSLSLSEQHLIELNEKGQFEYARLLELSNRLSDARKNAADLFKKSVTAELVFLDMPSVLLAVSLTQVKPNARGKDNVEFLISTNKGEPPKPIAKIASGGELSRIMLAIKNTLADKDEIQTLIFDEVDTGVSGRAAQKIGLKLKQAAHNRQILAVTHSAQIAALSDHHFLIKKESIGESTFTNVSKLSKEERIEEVARIMSTDNITDLMRQNAKEMIDSY